jgi:iron complex outermembrane receptor protein
MRKLLTVCLMSFSLALSAQQTDSLVSLKEVTVRGFENNRQLITIPASVSVLRNRDLQRYSNTTLVPVVNTIPGVRMEERSPASYRLSIRGSMLRSPFGVRNVKIYWKDFPLTDAGGNTYLNLVDFNGVGEVEVLRGPSGSIYGAGTGGVMTIREPAIQQDRKNQLMVQLNGGSYGLFGATAKWQGHYEKTDVQVMQSHLQSDGYRDNSRMNRDLTQASMKWNIGERNTLEGVILLAGLEYRTPGGLTLAQMNANPRQSRPATAVLPSALEQKAGIKNKTIISGWSDKLILGKHWNTTNSAAISLTKFENPFITNFEKREELNLSLRSVFQYTGNIGKAGLQWISGLEWQNGFYRIDSTGNNKGEPDNNLVRDEVKAVSQFLFNQAELTLGRNLIVHVGLSLNNFSYNVQRVITPSGEQKINFDLQLVPRFAMLYKLSQHASIHLSASKGYSPPTLAEIRPSAGGISTDLQAEYGWNYEAGIKSSLLRSRVNFDITIFRFDLQNAIVRRTNAAGAEYFVNAGGTEQKGVEAFAEAFLVNRDNGWLHQLRLWSSATFFHFRFTDYKVNTTDYSGNKLTGVPSQTILAGTDFIFAKGLYWNTTFNYTSSLPLNDMNDMFADDYRLWQSRIGIKWKSTSHFAMDIFAGIDNAANQLYSLGNDINAFGRRYFNPAADRNYYGGIRLIF